MLPKLKPLKIKDRLSVLFVEKGLLDVRDGAFVVVDKNGVRTHIPIGSVTCLMLEPGARISHSAVVLAARVGCLLLWVGEAGVRLYAAGQPGGARSDRLIYQVRLASDKQARLKVARKMYELRFNEKPPTNRSLEQLRSMEGARVKAMYQLLAQKYKIKWRNRSYDPSQWDSSDPINKSLSASTACLYGITEAAVLAAGYSPSVGFIHSGKPLSFVYDIADLFKFETVVPLAFRAAAAGADNPERQARLACRDYFRQSRVLKKIVPTIDQVLQAGGMEPPGQEDVLVGPAFPEPEGIGDVGHRT